MKAVFFCFFLILALSVWQAEAGLCKTVCDKICPIPGVCDVVCKVLCTDPVSITRLPTRRLP